MSANIRDDVHDEPRYRERFPPPPEAAVSSAPRLGDQIEEDARWG